MDASSAISARTAMARAAGQRRSRRPPRRPSPGSIARSAPQHSRAPPPGAPPRAPMPWLPPVTIMIFRIPANSPVPVFAPGKPVFDPGWRARGNQHPANRRFQRRKSAPEKVTLHLSTGICALTRFGDCHASIRPVLYLVGNVHQGACIWYGTRRRSATCAISGQKVIPLPKSVGGLACPRTQSSAKPTGWTLTRVRRR